MKITYDSKANATYVTLRKLKKNEYVDKTIEMGDYYIDFDAKGKILGIEYLSAPIVEIDGAEVKLR
jgi:uncharacterized protein YuzE